MNRRNFLTGIAGILAAGCAPRAISSGVLMPVRDLWLPPPEIAIPPELIFEHPIVAYGGRADWLAALVREIYSTSPTMIQLFRERLRPEMTITRRIQYR